MDQTKFIHQINNIVLIVLHTLKHLMITQYVVLIVLLTQSSGLMETASHVRQVKQLMLHNINA